MGAGWASPGRAAGRGDPGWWRSRLAVLQECGAYELDDRAAGRVVVVEQSVPPLPPVPGEPRDHFGHHPGGDRRVGHGAEITCRGALVDISRQPPEVSDPGASIVKVLQFWQLDGTAFDHGEDRPIVLLDRVALLYHAAQFGRDVARMILG